MISELLELLKTVANWTGNGAESGSIAIVALLIYMFRDRIIGPHLSLKTLKDELDDNEKENAKGHEALLEDIHKNGESIARVEGKIDTLINLQQSRGEARNR